MPITTMCDKTTPGAYQVKHPAANGHEIWLYDHHHGVVLATGEHNYYDDSDFYAVIWDDEQSRPVEYEYASTRGWSYCNHAEIDATPEVIDKYKKWYIAEEARIAELKAQREAKDPTKGKKVRVTGGRKYKGMEGYIFWRGVNKYRTYYRNGYNRPEALHNQVLGIQTIDNIRFFIGADKVEVII